MPTGWPGLLQRRADLQNNPSSRLRFADTSRDDEQEESCHSSRSHRRYLQGLHVDLAISRLNTVDLYLLLCRTSDNPPVSYIELRAVPWTLDRAAYQRAIGERAAFVGTGIAKGKQTFGAPSDHHAFGADDGQQHLAVS